MKTSTTLRQNSSHFYLIGLLSFLLASCGSYQNTSYQDNDGVYGGSQRTYAQTANNTNNQYKDYFRSLQDDNQPTEIFTDVDSYGNYAQNDSTQTTATAYPAWGSSNSEVSVNVYSDPTWSIGFGFGYGYPYYGWGYGGYWGYPSYWGPGWGYPGWGYPGWGYPGYYRPYYNNYSYNYGRRGSAAYYGGRNYGYDRNYTGRGNYNRNYTTNRSYNTNRRDYTTNRSNGYTDFRRSSTVNGRSYNSTNPTFTDRRGSSAQYNGGDYNRRSSSTTNSNRSYNYNNSNSSPARSYSPSPSRSMNSGGGGSMRSSGGGGGGGRSYGGGGGGRR
jgi:hypothetical protein